jgi:hypothetical protein
MSRTDEYHRLCAERRAEAKRGVDMTPEVAVKLVAMSMAIAAFNPFLAFLFLPVGIAGLIGPRPDTAERMNG